MDPRVEKLPKWAQDHIKDLQYQRDAANRRLSQVHGSQVRTPYSCDSLVTNGEGACGGPIHSVLYYDLPHVKVAGGGVEVMVQDIDGGVEVRFREDRECDITAAPGRQVEIAVVPGTGRLTFRRVEVPR